MKQVIVLSLGFVLCLQTHTYAMDCCCFSYCWQKQEAKNEQLWLLTSDDQTLPSPRVPQNFQAVPIEQPTPSIFIPTAPMAPPVPSIAIPHGSKFDPTWNLSSFLETKACILATKKALCLAKPKIINSDQGCQFTSAAWCDFLSENDIEISMDGKGRWADNILIERFWRTIKYELIFLQYSGTIEGLRAKIEDFIERYNKERPHQALKYQVPENVYKKGLISQDLG